jgi:hypothetical protein
MALSSQAAIGRAQVAPQGERATDSLAQMVWQQLRLVEGRP